ncbi:MAG: nuclear transport factor 2 family protein [Bacteroidia bacterium]|nr:nuclear transport factor 2 family protein [Bacteroidia bacterium]MDW8348048.1 nuclear transport factor 2 family protein [Bacteroidia bacterium]
MLLSWFVGLYLAQAQDLRHKDKKAIMEVLEKQVEAWNRQDIEGFMEAYWKSDSLKFIGRNGLTKGWQAALDRYKKNYPDKNAMGVLKFEILNIQGICSHAAVVTGKWILTRSVGNLQGFFSLIFEYIDKKWVIVYDHSI